MKSPFLVLKPTTTGLGLIVVLIVANLVVSQWNIRRLNHNAESVIRTYQVLAALDDVLSGVTEAETSERGFVIRGDRSYSASYEAAAARTEQTLQRLAILTSGNAREQAQLAALREHVELRLGELRNAIEVRGSRGFEAARIAVLGNHGRELMSKMRALVGELQSQERKALATRSDESRRSVDTAMICDWIGTLVGVGTVALAFVLFNRELSHRERADIVARQLAAIVESSDDAIVGKSLDGIIESWNAGARRLYGYTADEVIGRPMTMLCPPERVDEIAENLMRVRRGVYVEHYLTTRVRKDGQRIDVSLTISPIKSAAGVVIGASAIGRDITAQKLLERELLETAAREQRRIGQDLHDDTGQQLTGLAMMAQRLSADLVAHGLPQSAAAARIVDGLEHTLGQVRALAKGLQPVELDSDGLMASLLDLAARTSQVHAIHCAFECHEPVSIPDNQTATHLYRMAQEAVTNALKHGRAQNIAIGLAAGDETVKLTIADGGCGFPAGEPKATGTGLRIMRYRADLIGAILTIEPLRPHGTLLTCVLSTKTPAIACRDRPDLIGA